MPILNGTYRAKARTWTLAESSKGTPEAAVEFTFSSPDMQGQSITWHGYLSEAAFKRTIEGLRYCGWEGDDLSDLSGLDTNEVDLVIENEEYEGEVHPKVKWVNRAGGLAVKAPMSQEKAKAFAASMKGHVRAFDASKGTKPASNGSKAKPSSSSSSESGDFDVPF